LTFICVLIASLDTVESRNLMVAPPVRCARLFVLCALFIVGNQVARGGLITSFQTAFQPTTPAPGWAYLWNDAGPIGYPANYTPLLPTMSGIYTSDGLETRPAPPPGNFIAMYFVGVAPGGHPGMGALQAGSGSIERYTIAAYTLSSPDKIALLNGWLRNANPNSGGSTDGVSLKVFVNDESLPRISTGTSAGYDSTASFNVGLGNLNAGDKIYVAMGSRNTDLFDGFQLRYDIASVPEPTTKALATLGLLALVCSPLVRRHVAANKRQPSEDRPLGRAPKAWAA
jgi:hypothetical protein